MVYKMIADRIIRNVSTNTPLDMEYRDIYAYSLERYLSNIFNLIIFAVVAIALRIPGEAIVFAFFYGPLRKFAGGIHVKSRGFCLVLSLVIMVSVIWLSKGIALLPYWRMISFILLGLACILIYKLAPVDSVNRRLSKEKKYLFRKRSRWIISLEAITLSLGIMILDVFTSYIILGVLAVLLEGIFLVPNKSDS
ncbi:MAG: hypothetical protein K0R34_2500 [Herbinix sp.]|jgi:accessory gene regulator B|nr:hypothetical protein [Herbinix sp.]